MDGTLRFSVSKDGHKAYNTLCKGENSLFPQFTDMFYWCAILGFKSGQDRRPLGQKEGVFTWSAFQDDQKTALLSLAIHANGDFSILCSETGGDGDAADAFQGLRILLEEYAEIGLTILLNLISDDKAGMQNNYETLLAYIIENREKIKDQHT